MMQLGARALAFEAEAADQDGEDLHQLRFAPPQGGVNQLTLLIELTGDGALTATLQPTLRFRENDGAYLQFTADETQDIDVGGNDVVRRWLTLLVPPVLEYALRVSALTGTDARLVVRGFWGYETER